ncbi:MAG: class I SAM-dependent methyltransferase [bacterium]|nr:class I SAM-dependent methyltransferase [bacterium]
MSEIEPIRQVFGPLWGPGEARAGKPGPESSVEERTGPPPPGSGAMFDRIAGRYDLLNRLMTFGLDRRWRRLTVAALDLEPGCRILDLAAGTADMALEVLRQCPRAKAVGLDPSPGMLEIGRRKVGEAGFGERIELRRGRAEALPFADRSFDGVSIAFGIRNVPDRAAGLREMARVTRPAGRIAILEGTEPRSGPLAPLVRWHLRSLVPRLGALLSRAPEYRYLQRSIGAFPPPPEFARLMAACGLEVLRIRPLAFGACSLFVARPVGGGA